MFDQYGQPTEPDCPKVVICKDFWGDPLYEGEAVYFLEDEDAYIHAEDLDKYAEEIRKRIAKQPIEYLRKG